MVENDYPYSNPSAKALLHAAGDEAPFLLQ
jgi:hypothetical protein